MILIRDWLPVLLWMAAIFWGSSRSTLPGPLGAQTVCGDWLRDATHMAEYAILSALAHRALRKTPAAARRPSSFPSHFSFLRAHFSPFVLALALSLGYAFLDETHQLFVPGRQFALWDIVLDASGSVLALAALRTFLP